VPTADLQAPDEETRPAKGVALRVRGWSYVDETLPLPDPPCAKDVVGLDALSTDLRSVATTPNLSYITPNSCNDGHDQPFPCPSRVGRQRVAVAVHATVRVDGTAIESRIVEDVRIVRDERLACDAHDGARVLTDHSGWSICQQRLKLGSMGLQHVEKTGCRIHGARCLVNRLIRRP
jgi:hypothetical protein